MATPGAKKPPYAWRCSACEATNDAGIARCNCGLAAYSDGRAIAQRTAQLRPPPAPRPEAPKPGSLLSGNDWILFFPEGIFAAITVLALPFWAWRLMHSGAFMAAASLLALSGVGIALSLIAWRGNHKWLLYAGMMFILLGAWSAV